MIPSSRIMQIAALLAAGTVHAALAVAVTQGGSAQVEGAPGGVDLRLGTSFAELAVGASHVPADTTAPAASGHRTAVATPHSAATPPAPPSGEARGAGTSHADASAEGQRPASEAHVSETAPTRGVAGGASRAGPALDVALVGQAVTARPERPEKVPRAVEATTPAPADAARAKATGAAAWVRPEPVAAARGARAPTAATARAAVAPERSPRPPARPEATARADRVSDTSRPAPAPAGNGARAGSAEGRTEGTQASAGQGAAQAAGNAAASDYPGLVMRCIARAGRPRVGGSGTARVAFAVAADGRIASVGLAASSGDGALDRAAVALIRRVGACPPPPPGAMRRFSIAIEAR